ncbi:hypothetical protein V8G54_036694 [Vigna mungo]|uniref:Uncharacterized protein n=1 Tax=Vigna mungo TaxID=3915 RepID=A0AAQ3RGU9_VIGMU
MPPINQRKKGSPIKGFRNPRSTREVRKITPASSCSGEVRKSALEFPAQCKNQVLNKSSPFPLGPPTFNFVSENFLHRKKFQRELLAFSSQSREQLQRELLESTERNEDLKRIENRLPKYILRKLVSVVLRNSLFILGVAKEVIGRDSSFVKHSEEQIASCSCDSTHMEQPLANALFVAAPPSLLEIMGLKLELSKQVTRPDLTWPTTAKLTEVKIGNKDEGHRLKKSKKIKEKKSLGTARRIRCRAGNRRAVDPYRRAVVRFKVHRRAAKCDVGRWSAGLGPIFLLRFSPINSPRRAVRPTLHSLERISWMLRLLFVFSRLLGEARDRKPVISNRPFPPRDRVKGRPRKPFESHGKNDNGFYHFYYLIRFGTLVNLLTVGRVDPRISRVPSQIQEFLAPLLDVARLGKQQIKDFKSSFD